LIIKFNLRLARDSPGYYDFSPHFSDLFTLLLSTLKIELGVDRIVSKNNNDTNDVVSLAQIFAYSFGMADNKYFFFWDGIFCPKKNFFFLEFNNALTNYFCPWKVIFILLIQDNIQKIYLVF
jgi:hypothetical protein